MDIGFNAGMTNRPDGEADPVSERIRAAAERALAEAEERRKRRAETAALPREIDGRGGPEPVRFGDWEVKGIATDF
jgi:hypothetical protein